MRSGSLVALIATLHLLWLYPTHINGTFYSRSSSRQKLDKDLEEDATLTAPELIRKYNYPVETHTIETPDGYLIDAHRIPRENGIPVLLMHGIMDSSGGWIISGTSKSLAYMLWNHGYDVWLGNVRGNRYARKHKTLDVNSSQFWEFSFHEIGIYDLPAIIDHITQLTKYPKIHYIGYSQGTTTFFIMCSEVPGYCNKIIAMNALAPSAYMGHSKSPLIVFLSRFIGSVERIAKLIGVSEFFPIRKRYTAGIRAACRDEAATQILCTNSIFLIVGYNSEQLNTTVLPVMFGHAPAGASTKQLIHYGQLVQSGRFQQYDYGSMQNQMRYRQPNPPQYNLSKVTAPIALNYGRNDLLCVPQDVEHLIKDLPNVIKSRMVPHPKFSHGDFMYAVKAKELVYQDVVKVMRQVEMRHLFNLSKNYFK